MDKLLILKVTNMRTIEEYKAAFKLFDEDMEDFKQFLSDPNQKEFYPISRMIEKCEDGSLCIHVGRFKTIGLIK